VLLWPWALALLPAAPLAVLLLAALAPQRSLTFTPAADRALLSEPFFLPGGPLGSPLLQVEATIPQNTNLTYQLELLDPAGQVVLELRRDGWRETGTWTEDGESGTYDERDTAVPLLLRPAADGPHRLRLRLEELSGADGRPVAEPVGFQARLATHRVNAPLLLLTAATGLVCSVCAWMAFYSHCRRCHVLRLEEGRARLRTDLGPGLVRLWLEVRYEPEWDGVLPESVRLRLQVRDGLGRDRLRRAEPLPLTARTSNDSTLRFARARLVLRLPERCNLALQVELPESLGPARDALEQLCLTVQDGVRLPWPQPVLELDPPAR
jgi:hypothetical protein